MTSTSNPPKAEWEFKPVHLPGTLYHYAPKLNAFEFSPTTNDDTDHRQLNTLLFIGGLGDEFLSPSYVHKSLVPAIYKDKQMKGWRVVEVGISSSGPGWGTGSVRRDAEELAKCVYYFKALRPQGKVVLMGHSTGCQDALYLMTHTLPTPPLDGIILQAPVSDREALSALPTTSTLLTIATQLVNALPSPDHPTAPRGNTILPIELTTPIFGAHTPISANRWYSLTAPPDLVTQAPTGEEDFFSSDFPEKVVYKYTFGKLKPDSVRVLVLYSEEDEWVPGEIDKEKLVGTWIKVMKEKGIRVDEKRSGVVEEATHDLNDVDESVMQDVIGRVKGFLGSVVADHSG